MEVIRINFITRLMNRYVRKLGRSVNFFLFIAIFILYGLEISRIINIPNSLEAVFFIALTGNNLIFYLYSLALRTEFNFQVRVYLNRGIPLESTEGFQYSRDAVQQTVRRTRTMNIFVILGSMFHFTPELITQFFNANFVFISYFGIGMVLIALSIFIANEYPDHTLLQPGNFISYHKPKSFPTFLDNILADSLKSFMDPRTRFQLDNWLIDVGRKLHPDYESDEPQQTRIERAIERIILLHYLNKKVPKLVTEEVIRSDLRKIVRLETKQDFITGEDSGLSLKVISDLIDVMIEDVPEIFQLVDRLLVEIMVNPTMFRTQDKIIETIIPDNEDLDVNQAFRIMVFVLNMVESRDQRIIEVIAESSRHIEPPQTSVKFTLDEYEEKILGLLNQHDEEDGVLVYSDRIIEILSNMLQVGDVTWLQFIPQEYGRHVLNIMVKENGFQSFGTSVPIDVSFSFRNNLRKMMSGVSRIGGMIYPILKAVLLNPIF